jgi:anti-sigma regulatory factor (Ser/Thr protein kinase)
LAAANRLVGAGDEQMMATAVLLMLDRDSGEVAFTRAGHPPPLVIEDGRARFLEGATSIPLGAGDTAVFSDSTDRLQPGATLLLYTDGLVERRGERLDARLDELAAAAPAHTGADLEALCDSLLVRALGSGAPQDDVALIAVRPEPVSRDRLAVTLPTDPDAIAQLRRRVGRFLHAAGADATEEYEIVLTVSEAAANAVEHAYGPGDEQFEVELALQAGEVVAEVRDHGGWRPRRGPERGRGLKIMEGLMDVVEVERGEGGTSVRLRRRLTGATP